MKHSLAILTAAVATIASMFRSLIESQIYDPDDDSRYHPMLTADEVSRFVSNGATDKDLTEYFLVDAELIQKRFGRLIQSQRAMYRMGLRGLQIQAAKKLAPSVLIFLGKNELGQSNNPSKPGEPEPEFEADAI